MENIPEDNIILAFKILINSGFYRENEEYLLDFFNYIEETWINRPRRRKRKTPLFKINIRGFIVHSMFKYNSVNLDLYRFIEKERMFK